MKIKHMKKIVFILFSAFIFVSCGGSHHQVTGTVDYCLEGDTTTYTVPFQHDYYRNKRCKDLRLKPIVCVDENGSVLNCLIVSQNKLHQYLNVFGTYQLVNVPGRKISYTNMQYEYTVEIK